MGLSILGPGGVPGVPVRAEIQIGPGDMIVALLLMHVLAYLYLLEPADIPEERKHQLRLLLVSVAIPFSVTFLAVLLFTVFAREVVLVVV